MPIIVAGLSHHTSSVELREKFAFTDAAIPETLRNLRDSGLASEGVILSTCNRVEVYAVTPSQESKVHELREFICRERQFPVVGGNGFYLLNEPQSIEHLFKVA